MKSNEAAKLEFGARVMWQSDALDAGTIIAVNDSSAQVAWDNGNVGLLHFSDMKEVSLLAPSTEAARIGVRRALSAIREALHK